MVERRELGRNRVWGGWRAQWCAATARALPMRVCASVQASETDGMDPKSKVMTVYSGKHAGRQPQKTQDRGGAGSSLRVLDVGFPHQTGVMQEPGSLLT